jgi:Uma2 family endonuclease
MSRTLSKSPISPASLEDTQHLLLEGISWDLYEKLLAEIGDRAIRMTYDEERLEIMSPLAEHEQPRKMIARMIEMLTFELNLPVSSLGSTTFRRKDKAKGLEPDECYFFRDEKKMRGRKRWYPRKDPPPELVVEIDITSRSIDREPVYAALGVPEIWRYDGRKIECLQLHDGVYRLRKQSLALPFLEPGTLKRFLTMARTRGETAAIRAFVNWDHKHGWAAPQE